METVPNLAEVLLQHGGNMGTSFSWEMQLLATEPPKH
jgi:hypothetical protein